VHETFSLFQHHSNLFEITFFDENQHGREVKIHLDAKIKEDLNKNQGEKRKLNAVAEKENTHRTIRVKNGVFLANQNKYISSKRNLLGTNHLLQKTKLNKTEN
jgi:hypothetical protein